MIGFRSARYNDLDIERLIQHIKSSHRSLLDPVCDGPLDPTRLTEIDGTVLLAIHHANHVVPWRDHHIDDWRADPKPDSVADPKPDPAVGSSDVYRWDPWDHVYR